MKTFNHNGIEVPRYVEGEYYKAKNSDLYYRFYSTMNHGTKYYSIDCYEHAAKFVDIGYFKSTGLREARYALHRLVSAKPNESLRFSQYDKNDLVDTNSEMWKIQDAWSRHEDI